MYTISAILFSLKSHKRKTNSTIDSVILIMCIKNSTFTVFKKGEIIFQLYSVVSHLKRKGSYRPTTKLYLTGLQRHAWFVRLGSNFCSAYSLMIFLSMQVWTVLFLDPHSCCGVNKKLLYDMVDMNGRLSLSRPFHNLSNHA